MKEYIIEDDIVGEGQFRRIAFGKVTGELIRCKDCKRWLPHEQFGYDADNDEYHNYCGQLVPSDDWYAYTREADDYCSRAERRGEEWRSQNMIM